MAALAPHAPVSLVSGAPGGGSELFPFAPCMRALFWQLSVADGLFNEEAQLTPFEILLGSLPPAMALTRQISRQVSEAVIEAFVRGTAVPLRRNLGARGYL